MNSIKKLVASFEPFYLPQLESPAPQPEDEKDEKELRDEPKPESTDPESPQSPEDHTSTIPDNQEFESISKPRLSPLRALWSAVLFLPQNLILRPLMLLWLLITFPFTYFFEQEYPQVFSSNTTPSQEEQREKTELLKQERILANNIKLPTSLLKYFIPPPPRLFPLSRNPDRRKKKKVLILDLDETLIHSLSRGAPRSLGGSGGQCHMIELKVNNVLTLYYVYKRPYCDFFLKELSKWFELQIFTASVQEYADPIIDWLEMDMIDYKKGLSAQVPPNKVFTKRYYRNDCTYRPGVGYIKDLSRFFPHEELKNVIILDNSPISYALHEHNAVMIEGWINDQSDRDLINLLPMLFSLSMCIDVRYILGMRSGEKLFESL